MIHALLLTAAGSSVRMGGTKKEYLTVRQESTGTVSVLSSSLYAFLATGLFSRILITVPKNGETEARKILAADGRLDTLSRAHNINLLFAEGGSSRQESVRLGLERLALDSERLNMQPDTVLIHDAARPWVSDRLIREVLETTLLRGAAVPGVSPVDTEKEIDRSGKIIRHLERSRIVCVQTPQGFRFSGLLSAHRMAATDGKTYTDDAEIWGCYAGDVYTIDGDRENKKITYPGDV